MPLLFYTYLTSQILKPFFASLFIITGLLFIGNINKLLKIATSFHVPAADIIQIAAYTIPWLLLFAIPMASMMGVLLGLNRMACDGEIMALKSGGIGLGQIMRPIIVIALCTMTITGLCSLVLGPHYTTAINTKLVNLTRKSIPHAIQANQFSRDLGGIVIYVETIKQANHWQGVYIMDNRLPETPAIITATSATLTLNGRQNIISITLNNGSMRRTNFSNRQAMEFRQFTINIPIYKIGNSKNIAPGKRSLNQPQLMAKAHKYGLQTKKGTSFLREYHKRLALPISAFILTLLAIPLGLRATPNKPAHSISLGLAFFILYYICLTTAEAISDSLIIPATPAMWLPNILFAILTLAMLYNSQTAQ